MFQNHVHSLSETGFLFLFSSVSILIVTFIGEEKSVSQNIDMPEFAGKERITIIILFEDRLIFLTKMLQGGCRCFRCSNV